MAGELTAQVVAHAEVFDVENVEHGRVYGNHDDLLHENGVDGEGEEGSHFQLGVLGPEDGFGDGEEDLEAEEEETHEVPVADAVHDPDGEEVDGEVEEGQGSEVVAVLDGVDEVGDLVAEHGPAVEPVNAQQKDRKAEIAEELEDRNADADDVVAVGPDVEEVDLGLGETTHLDGQEELEQGDTAEDEVGEDGLLEEEPEDAHAEEKSEVDDVLLHPVFEGGNW